MNIHQALESLDALQAQILHGGRPFGDIADAIRADRAEKRKALERCLQWTHRAIDLEVSSSMKEAAEEHAKEARAILWADSDQPTAVNPNDTKP